MTGYLAEDIEVAALRAFRFVALLCPRNVLLSHDQYQYSRNMPLKRLGYTYRPANLRSAPLQGNEDSKGLYGYLQQFVPAEFSFFLARILDLLQRNA